ncbi:hypothetical protein N7489_010735 [Penicillium chrysogenum]|jgi:hypothetical protein|uniref:CYTH domain-containing protein n=1 Tax=Penicillium chrysogenum TaxID=5076 RepID=A0ABQ8WTY6_PENCH|nr:uncharacterized protein N7489_010735 [Penicillium chrysogenum]KAJ5230027.1 hypothetical protein N7489_010735 [Penicillium chrysogenum]KAJ5271701.1 hypothetical protein N7524_004970 [Penicillium chrysogenum]KAJ5282080.1 hypothetical protein N7505_000060 [Penicillium chrysogenum]KAJ6141001.1 hypothetical protein N7497_011894 [Penicillium chrysogenum]
MKPWTILFSIFLKAPFVYAEEKISLQWAICDPTPQDTLAKLGLHEALPYKENPITYYDEYPPIHISSGLMFRTKTNKGQPLSTVKVRFPEVVPGVPDFVDCSWDYYGGNRPSFTCEKRCPLDSKIWHEEQVQFAERYGTVDWDKLRAYGPYQNAKWKVQVGGHKAKFDDVVAGELHLMEIEAKVLREEADDALQAITNYLNERSVVLCEPQEGKTMRLFRAMGHFGNGREEL